MGGWGRKILRPDKGYRDERSEDISKWGEWGKSLGIDNLNPNLLYIMMQTTYRVRNNQTRIYRSWGSWMGDVGMVKFLPPLHNRLEKGQRSCKE